MFATEMPLSVVIVDAQPIFADVLTAITRSAFPAACIGTARDLAQGLASARAAANVGLVLLDLELPGCDGIVALSVFRKALPAAKIVVVSAVEARRIVLSALEAGAAGYIPKSVPPPVIAAALRLVVSGGTYAPPDYIAPVAASAAVNEPASPASRTTLTARQREVLRLIACGLANKEIARRLRITEETVKQHARAVYMALGVAGRWQAARVAESLGMVEIDRE